MRRCHSVRPRGGFHGVSCQEVEHRGRLFARRQDHVDGCSPTGAGGNLTGLDPGHIEFLRLSEKRILVIIVSPDGDVQNRVLFTESDFDQSQLVEASNYLNAHYSGMAMEQVWARLKTEVESLRSEIAGLMQAAIQASTEAMQSAAEQDVVIAGERNLLSVSDFSSDMSQLRRAFDLFEQKTLLMRLLDESSQAEGVHIYIGGESQVVPVEELSVVTAPYSVDGQVVGTLGVIGPIRMPYARMVEVVDITARLLGNALSPRN